MKNYEEIKCEVIYNYTIIIVEMHEKMRAAINKFFTPRRRGETPAKILGI